MQELCNWLAMIKDGHMFLAAALLGKKLQPGSRSVVELARWLFLPVGCIALCVPCPAGHFS